MITLTCDRPPRPASATSVGGGPADGTGSDVLMTDLGQGFYVEALTEKGAKLLEGTALKEGAPYEKEAQEERRPRRRRSSRYFPAARSRPRRRMPTGKRSRKSAWPAAPAHTSVPHATASTLRTNRRSGPAGGA